MAPKKKEEVIEETNEATMVPGSVRRNVLKSSATNSATPAKAPSVKSTPAKESRSSRASSAAPPDAKESRSRASSAADEGKEAEVVVKGERSTASKEAKVAATSAKTPAKEKIPATPVKSDSSSSTTLTVKSTGKRGRNDDVTPVQGQNKISKGKQLSEDEQEEIVTRLKFLSSINGLEANGDGINSTNQKGETYLHFAAFNAEPQLVKWLIEKGADCNLQDEKGRTALSRCASGDHQCVRMLLQASADVDLVDKEGISPLHYASLSSSYENVNLMLQYEAHISTFDKTNGSSPLHDACYSGSLRCVKALVEAGAHVDMPTKSSKEKNKGAVALHYAAQENRHEIVEYLIRKRAGVNIQDARGCTPLHYAAYTGSVETVRVLLKNKANTSIQDATKKTAEQLLEISPNATKDASLRDSMLIMLKKDQKKEKRGGCVLC